MAGQRKRVFWAGGVFIAGAMEGEKKSLDDIALRDTMYQKTTNHPNNPDKIMPEIARFLGIIIAMYHDEHNPPHFLSATTNSGH